MAMSAAERQRKRREKLKSQEPDKYEEKKRKHANYMKNKRKPIGQLSATEQNKKRKQWREANARRNNRNGEKMEDEAQKAPSKSEKPKKMPMSAAERQRKRREKLKSQEPDKYEEKKRKHANYMKNKRKPIGQLSVTEQNKKRKQWREANARRNNRNGEKMEDEAQKTPSKACFERRCFRALTKDDNSASSQTLITTTKPAVEQNRPAELPTLTPLQIKVEPDLQNQEVRIRCPSDVNKLVQRNGNDPLTNPEGRVRLKREEGDTVVGDVSTYEEIDMKDITFVDSVGVINEEFISEEVIVEKNEDDKEKKLLSTHRNGNDPLTNPEGSVRLKREEGDTVVGDVSTYEEMDMKDITFVHSVGVINEEFISEEVIVEKNEDDEDKKLISTDWVIQKCLCRCCLAEGDFTSFLTETHENKSYEDLLQTCFDIQLHSVEGYAGAGALRALCGLCEARLQDAYNFKSQVKAAEERFQELLNGSCIKVASNNTIQIEVKEEEHDDTDNIGLCADKVTSNKRVVQDSKRKKLQQKERTIKPKPKKLQQKQRTRKPKPKKNEGVKKRRIRTIDYYERVGASFKCSKCEHIFQEISEAVLHYRKTHKYKCSYCPMILESFNQHITHLLQEHNIDKRHKCNACNRYFNSKGHFMNHQSTYHMLGKKFKCSMCDFECYCKSSLNKHMVKHATSKEFQCKFCKKAFVRRSNLTVHEKIHTGDKRKACNECGETFVQKASLNYHMAKYHPAVKY